MLTVVCWRGVFKMCVLGDLLSDVVVRVWTGVVLCRMSLWLVVGVGVRLVVFMVECVSVVVMGDDGWETVENRVDVMEFREYWCLVWWVGGPSLNLSIMEYCLMVSKPSSSSTSRSGPKRSMSDSQLLNKIISSSKFCWAVRYSSGCPWLAKELGWIIVC